jgi:hypothetical protein
MLVTLLITSVMLTLLGAFFYTNVDTQHNMSLQVEAQQGLRGLMEMITQELRQAGACLPQLGQFIALDGTNDGTHDSLTIRIGRTTPRTLVCVKAGTTVVAPSGSTILTVGPGEGDLFEGVTLAYVTPNAAEGDFYPVTSHTATTITLGEGLHSDHPLGSGVYGVDARAYTIDTATDNAPVLTVAIDGGSPQPLVDGVEKFNVQYRLEPCPPCHAVNEPADDTEWRLVREVSLAASVRSRKADKEGEFAHESGEVTIKPRNLL